MGYRKYRDIAQQKRMGATNNFLSEAETQKNEITAKLKAGESVIQLMQQPPKGYGYNAVVKACHVRKRRKVKREVDDGPI